MESVECLERIVVDLYRRINTLNAQVTALVAQVATNVSTDTAAANALKSLVSQVAALQAQLNTAIANGFGADDVAALTKAVGDLSTSATSFASATPAPAPVAGS